MDLSSSHKIHEGRFSLVYVLAKGEEKYIVKQLHPRISGDLQHVEKFRAEAAIPFIPGLTPPTIDYIEEDGKYYIVKRYVEGMTFKELHKKYRGRKFHVSYLHLYNQALQKIKHLHQAGYIHTDIKPSNILFTGKEIRDTGDVVLLDPGLALEKDKLPPKKAPLSFSMVYAAPELMLNEPGLIGEHTDIFSWAVCLYEALSGQATYQENHPAVLLQMMLSVPLQPIRKVSKELNAFILPFVSKPGFKKPIAQYTYSETMTLLEENIRERKSYTEREDPVLLLNNLVMAEKNKKRFSFLKRK